MEGSMTIYSNETQPILTCVYSEYCTSLSFFMLLTVVAIASTLFGTLCDLYVGPSSTKAPGICLAYLDINHPILLRDT
jgi:hypothetical protein